MTDFNPSEMSYLPTFHLPTKQWCVELWPRGSPPQTVSLPSEWEAEHLPSGLGKASEPGVYPLIVGVSMGEVLADLKKREGFYRRTWAGEPDWEAMGPSDVSFRLCPEGVEFRVGSRVEAVPWWWRLQYHLVDYGVEYDPCRPGCHPLRSRCRGPEVAGWLVELGFKEAD